MKHILKYGVPAAPLLLLPLVTLAQFGGNNDINLFLQGVTSFIQTIVIPVLIAIAFVMFIYGAIRYFIVADESDGEGNREKGRKLMLWGIIGFVVIVSVWGIVALIANGLGFGGETQLDNLPNTPKLQ